MARIHDVAVVGFGPSGAVAAGLLGLAGLDTYVCDRQREVYDKPRAIALDHEIMRVFQQLGVVEAIAPWVAPFTPSAYFGVDGQLIRRMTMVEPPYPQGYSPSLVFTQPPVERLLRERAMSFPNVKVDLGVALQSLEQDDEAVTLHLTADDGSAGTVRARYVIGCDGASSTVRAQAGLALEDLDFDEPWLVVDVLVHQRSLAKLPATSVQYCEPGRPATMVIGPRTTAAGKSRCCRAKIRGKRQRRKAPGGCWHVGSARKPASCGDRRVTVSTRWSRRAGAAGVCFSPATRRTSNHPFLARACARARDARLLAECGGVVKDTPRQDVLPRLEIGCLSAVPGSARGTLFPQPRLLRDNGPPPLMDEQFGRGWRLVADHTLPPALRSWPGVTFIGLGGDGPREAEGVVAAWLQRHEVHAALVRPDHYVWGAAATADAVEALMAEWAASMA